jgi:hypothetical protein
MQLEDYHKDANNPSNFTSYRRYKSYCFKWNLPHVASSSALSHYFVAKRSDPDFLFVATDATPKLKAEEKSMDSVHVSVPNTPKNSPKSSKSLQDLHDKSIAVFSPANQAKVTNCDNNQDQSSIKLSVEQEVIPPVLKPFGETVLRTRRSSSDGAVSLFPFPVDDEKLAVKENIRPPRKSFKPLSLDVRNLKPHSEQHFVKRPRHGIVGHREMTRTYGRRGRVYRPVHPSKLLRSRPFEDKQRIPFKKMVVNDKRALIPYKIPSYFPSDSDPCMTDFGTYRAYKAFVRNRRLNFDQVMAYKVFMLKNKRYVRSHMIQRPRLQTGNLIRPLYTEYELLVLSRSN